MNGKIFICTGTSGVSAGAYEIASIFKAQLKQYALDAAYEVVITGDRGLFRDVLVDVISPLGERITYEYIKAENVPIIVKEHLLEGRPVKKLKAGKDYEQFFLGQMRIVLENCGEIDPENIDVYIQRQGYAALKKALTFSGKENIEKIKKSGLRGRGGAGG